MRFPIVRKDVNWVEYENLSHGLEESLMCDGIIDPVTGQTSQNYFDLPIDEGPILSYLGKTFEMAGEFHIGCSLDSRPPSFRFLMERTVRGERVSFVYRRELHFDVFRDGDFFRKATGDKSVRDLLALSEAYNQRGACRESVSLGCYRSGDGQGRYSEMSLILDRNVATLNPRLKALEGDYLWTLLEGTMIEDMLSRSEWKPIPVDKASDEKRILFFMSQAASKVFSPRTCIRYPVF